MGDIVVAHCKLHFQLNKNVATVPLPVTLPKDVHEQTLQ